MHELFHPALEAVSDAVLAVASRLPVEKSCSSSSRAHASWRALTTPRFRTIARRLRRGFRR